MWAPSPPWGLLGESPRRFRVPRARVYPYTARRNRKVYWDQRCNARVNSARLFGGSTRAAPRAEQGLAPDRKDPQRRPRAIGLSRSRLAGAASNRAGKASSLSRSIAQPARLGPAASAAPCQARRQAREAAWRTMPLPCPSSARIPILHGSSSRLRARRQGFAHRVLGSG